MAAKKKQAKPGKRLTDSQKLFIAAYLADPKQNATKAAKAAGYSSPKDSGWELMNLPQYGHVHDAIRREITERLTRLGMTAEEWMGRACLMVKLDRREIYRWDGEKFHITPTDDLSPEQALLIRDITHAEMDYGTTTKIKLADPTPYFQMIGRALGLFREVHDLDPGAELKAAEESLLSKLNQLAASLTAPLPVEPQPPGEASPPL